MSGPGYPQFAGLNAAPDWRKAAALARHGAALYPGLIDAATPMSRWMGHRPSLPDSLPVIDVSPRCRNIVLAFGHGHLGLTAAPRTADIVANLVLDRPAGIDLAPNSPGRFG
jgi:D-amino-acid dehydrogenase